MKKLLILLLMIISLGVNAKSDCEDCVVDGPKHLLLTPENAITFKGAVNMASASKVGKQLLELSAKARSDATLYLILDSPGGSIYAGMSFINLMKAIPQEINCVAKFAASMAHSILQACPGKRYISKGDGVIMIHRASGSFFGQFNNGEVESQLKLWKNIVSDLEKVNAKRMSYSLKEYRKRSKDEWWCSNNNCLKERFVDEFAYLRCSPELLAKKHKVNKHYYYSGCPLIPGYLKYESN